MFVNKNFSVEEGFVNVRLDRWFKKIVCDVPQSLIEKFLRKGNIKVNKKKKRGAYKLQTKDQININNLYLDATKHNKKKYIYKASKKDLSKTSTLFIENNENFVVINKPSGIPVQSGTKSRRNIIDILKETNEFDGFSPYTVHRIDKETTGVLIVAKNRKYAQLFTSLFRIRKIHKTYLCVVLGEMDKSSGTLKDNLYHYEGKKKIITEAVANFQVLDSKNNCSLLKINPVTGRKHQIRKQLLIRGNPIFGDSKYNINKNYQPKKGILMLHAHKINFSIGNISYKFQADPPEEFKEFIKKKYLKIY